MCVLLELAIGSIFMQKDEQNIIIHPDSKKKNHSSGS